MEWISVKDRLPEPETDVLTYNEKWDKYFVQHRFKHSYDEYTPVGDLFSKTRVTN